jgi:hypothetical protein
MDNQRLHNQDEIEKLRAQNEELKKNLEREQVLHSMLYKEWKNLDEQRAARENELQDPKSRNLFYKYAFYVILILLIPAIFFVNFQKNGKTTSGVDKTQVTNDSAIVQHSSKIKNSASAVTADSIQKIDKKSAANESAILPQPATEQPVVQTQEKKLLQHDTGKLKPIAVVKEEPDLPLSDSMRDSIYWIGWNAYYKKAGSHFRKSSQKYKAWLEGYNDGRKDAKKLLAKDSLENKR